jgi:hypothetical protein
VGVWCEGDLLSGPRFGAREDFLARRDDLVRVQERHDAPRAAERADVDGVVARERLIAAVAVLRDVAVGGDR